MPRVRTTMRPDEEIEVSEAEAAELRNRLLLVENDNDQTPQEPPFEVVSVDDLPAKEDTPTENEPEENRSGGRRSGGRRKED